MVYIFFIAHDLGVTLCDMDESALTLGMIDVSYLPNSSEYSIGRCKHASEEWVSLRYRLKAFSLKMFISVCMKVETLEATEIQIEVNSYRNCLQLLEDLFMKSNI